MLSSPAADAFGGTLALPTDSGENDPFVGYGAQWGYYRDAETGLYLCTFRYYDATEGRWLTPDPIGYPGGLNIYGYVGNKPTGFADPLGLLEEYSGLEQGIINGFGNLGTILGGIGGFGAGGGGAIAGGAVFSLATAPTGAFVGAGVGMVAGKGAGTLIGIGLVEGSRFIGQLFNYDTGSQKALPGPQHTVPCNPNPVQEATAKEAVRIVNNFKAGRTWRNIFEMKTGKLVGEVTTDSGPKRVIRYPHIDPGAPRLHFSLKDHGTGVNLHLILKQR